MKVAELMTTKIVAVRPDTPVKSIAPLLFAHGISAVPVVNADGVPIGMISEGDLMPRNESERDQRRDWWLRMLSEGEKLSPDFLQHIEDDKRVARDIMVTPIITIADTADVVEAAELLSEKRIKRLPVLRDGRIVGIVSRADLVRTVARPNKPEPVPSLNASPEIDFPPQPSTPRRPRQPFQLPRRLTRRSCPPRRFARWRTISIKNSRTGPILIVR